VFGRCSRSIGGIILFGNRCGGLRFCRLGGLRLLGCRLRRGSRFRSGILSRLRSSNGGRGRLRFGRGFRRRFGRRFRHRRRWRRCRFRFSRGCCPRCTVGCRRDRVRFRRRRLFWRWCGCWFYRRRRRLCLGRYRRRRPRRRGGHRCCPWQGGDGPNELFDRLQAGVKLRDLIRHSLHGRLDFPEFALLSLIGLMERRRLIGGHGWASSRGRRYLFLFRLRACQCGLTTKGRRIGKQGKQIEA